MAMAKQKKIEEPLESRSDDVEAVLARIAEFNTMAKSIRSSTLDTKTNPDNIYHLNVKQPESEGCYIFKRFHGKCIEAGFKPLAKNGYVYIVTGHSAKDDKLRSRTTCDHCGKELNPKLAIELRAEQAERRIKQRADFERRQRIQQAREDELVLLGKL